MPRMPIRALEFFSGIGGLHYGLERADPTATVLASFDMNQNANACYHANFGFKPSTTSIDTLSLQAVERFGANCWLLSPPCQPFTQGGKRLDHEDKRSLALLHLIDLLGQISAPPDFVFLENVPNFEVSVCRSRLVECLDARNYDIREFLVSPVQIGVANDRRRYYLCARRRSADAPKSDTPYLQAPRVITTMLSDPVKTFSQPGSDSDGRDTEPAWKPTPPQISSYLQPLEDVSPHLVPQEYILKRKSFRFDLVKPTDRISSCFTKAYGSHHVIGSGSFLQTERLDVEFAVDDGPSVVAARPRFFRPTEVARLHGFPIDGPPRGDPRLHAMAFPDSLSVAQQLKLLGNSLSVDVVAHLLSGLLAANAD